MVNISYKVEELFFAQLKEWNLASVNYGLLSKVKTKVVIFDEIRILIQFNPGRIRSSAARVDSKSIEARPCFLCEVNRPAQQRGLKIMDDMTVLVNPFPIFTKHLTIPSEGHIDQRIKNSFPVMLDIAKALPAYVVFYNGPECGASAPDHLHFQAGNRGLLPIEEDFERKKFVSIISDNDRFELWHWKGYYRGILTLIGRRPDLLADVFAGIYKKLSEIQTEKPEPMLNILAYYSAGRWIIHIIPRKLHRPTQFYAEGESNILLSPASVDLGGVLIVPREEDFRKITAGDIIDIFAQVCFDENEILNLTSYV